MSWFSSLAKVVESVDSVVGQNLPPERRQQARTAMSAMNFAAELYNNVSGAGNSGGGTTTTTSATAQPQPPEVEQRRGSQQQRRRSSQSSYGAEQQQPKIEQQQHFLQRATATVFEEQKRTLFTGKDKDECPQPGALFGKFSREVLLTLLREQPELVNLPHPDTAQTPLHCACIRGDLDASVQLAAYDADLNIKDGAGNTPLHYAIAKGNNPLVVKLLLLLGADPTIPNEKGHVPLTMRVQSSEINETLVKIGKWKQLEAKNPTESFTRLSQCLLVAPKSLEAACQREAIAQKMNLQIEKGPGNSGPCPLRLLSLDGGGIRGLVVAQMLFELEQRFQTARGTSRGKGGASFIKRNFDWIAGTSTGAILASALSMGFSPAQCIRLYLRLKDDIFHPKRPYPPEKIERFLRETFGEKRKMSEIGMSNRNGKIRVLLTATRADTMPLQLELYRNYGAVQPPPAPKDIEVWRACRRSSAAPVFFPKADECYLDGGLMANNPSSTLFREVSRQFMARQVHHQNTNISASTQGMAQQTLQPLRDGIAFILSIGTGKQPSKTLNSTDIYRPGHNAPGVSSSESSAFGPLGFFSSLTNNSMVTNFWALTTLKDIFVEQLTASDGLIVAETETRAHENGLPFFRFSPQLTEEVELDEVSNDVLVRTLWTTKVYANEECDSEMDTLIPLMEHFHG